MKKKILVLFVGLVMVLLLCACDSEEVKQAKEAYDNGDYAKAVELLSKEKDLSQDAQDILIISEANVLYEDGKCFDAVKKLTTSSQGVQAEQFDEMYQAALDESIVKPSSDNVIELLALDETKEDTVYKAVTKACKSKDYNAFRMLDGLVKTLPDGALKDKLTDFGKENDSLRAEAYLLGKWKETDEQGLNRTIEVTMSGDSMIGIIAKVDENQAYKKNDMYWTDFSVIDKNRITCNSISRGSDRDADDNAAVGEIDYEKGTMHLHLTPASGHTLTYYDTNWKRVE